MRLHRFYVLQPLGEEVVIEDVPTIKQWLKVFRYTAGDSIIMFNGDGHEYIYELKETSPTRCLLVLTEKKLSLLHKRRSYLYLAVIKKDLFELVCEKATELGITDIVPLFSERTEKKSLNEERLKTIIKEATEQSGRGDMPTLHKGQSLQEALTLSMNTVDIPSTYVATLFGETVHTYIKQPHDPHRPCSFFIGPEGGWSDNEEGLFEELGVTRISLGTTTLRAETAAIVASTVIPFL